MRCTYTQAEALRLIADIAEGSTTANSLQNIAKIARAALEAALKPEDARDAKRYLWLRDTGDATWRPFGLREGYSARQADAAIDAAMSDHIPDAGKKVETGANNA